MIIYPTKNPADLHKNTTFSSVFTVSHTREIQPSWYKSRFVNLTLMDFSHSWEGQGLLSLVLLENIWEK